MLRDITVRHAKATGKAYTLKDFEGLSLFVSASGTKAWHFRYAWLGQRLRISLGRYPGLSLRDARRLRDEARALLAKDINPQTHRKQKRQASERVAGYPFREVYEIWVQYRTLSLEEGRQSSLAQIRRIFEKDVLPTLGNHPIHEIKRSDLLAVVGQIEARQALTTAEKVRCWLRQLFEYAMVAIPDLDNNPATQLHVVAVPQPPVENNPFLRMAELPLFLQALRHYPGALRVQIAIRLLLLTGVRTGELRLATPDQFDLERGLWLIPLQSLKQRKMLARKSRRGVAAIPPYTVPLSAQAREIVRHLLAECRPAQKYLFCGSRNLSARLSENTVNYGIKRLGYGGRLTGHGIRATISTALNELGYPKTWVAAQLSHADSNRISTTYNHAEYVEQRRVMMQDWADRLDLFEQNQMQRASAHLVIHLQGLPLIARAVPLSAQNPHAPILLTAPDEGTASLARPEAQRLPAVELPEYARPKLSKLQQERLELLKLFEGPDNLSVADYAKLAGRSRRSINYDIQAGSLLSLSLGNKGQRVPVWQLDPLKRRLVQTILGQLPRGIDTWDIYHALLRPYEVLDNKPPLNALTTENLPFVAEVVIEQCR